MECEKIKIAILPPKNVEYGIAKLFSVQEEEKQMKMEIALENEVKQNFPNTNYSNIITFSTENQKAKRPLNLGVLLSGGPAAGGHNTICGIFNSMYMANSYSKLWGFLEGFQGLCNGKAIEITPSIINKYMNTGGFDMLSTSRVMLEKTIQLEACAKSLIDKNIDALVIIGGDDANTNGIKLAEHFLAKGINIQVIGVPKTIDGDLKNPYVEVTFGFETATKIYSSQIGNICRDAISSRKYWHFIKLMGRSSSHIALECALNTHPNFCFIGEEVTQKKITLDQIVNSIAEAVVERSKKNENFGVVLIPEGLIENIEEIDLLLKEIDKIKFDKKIDLAAKKTDEEKLTFMKENLKIVNVHFEDLFTRLPSELQKQFLFEKEGFGHRVVSQIDTEKLISTLVKKKLPKEQVFNIACHFFGYEGRCGIPTVFDANYAYALGQTAFMLVINGYTGYMAYIKNLHEKYENWIPGGVPIAKMLTTRMKEIDNKMTKIFCVKQQLVDLEGKPFKLFAKYREEWKTHSNYFFPPPIQYYGPESVYDTRPKTMLIERGIIDKLE